VNALKEIQKHSEKRIKRLEGNDAYLIRLIGLLTEIRTNDYAVSRVAQALTLGIMHESGDG